MKSEHKHTYSYNEERQEFQIETRKTTKEDTDFARETHHSAYRDVVIRQFGTWNENDQDHFFQESWNSEASQVITCDGTPCGYVYTETQPDRLVLHELVIRPEFQGRGIGSKILDNIVRKSQEKCIPIYLQVLHQNQAIELYKKFGFKKYETAENHIPMRRLV